LRLCGQLLAIERARVIGSGKKGMVLVNVTERIIDKVRGLSAADQQKVLELVSALPSVESNTTTEGSNGDHSREGKTVWERLAKLGESVEGIPCDLPDDLAANHDFYLHGLPKRK
jgi:hypothetical protein